MENYENQEISEMENQLSEPSEPKPAVEITSSYLLSTTKISGWLVFFIVIIMLGGFVSLVRAIISFDLSESGGSYLIAFSDIFLAAMCLFLASYTWYAFSNRLPNAVFLGKNYVVATFVINILTVILYKTNDIEFSSEKEVVDLVKSLIYSVVWFCYLCFSKQVAEVIPPSFRKVYIHNYIINVLIFIVPILMLVGGCIGLSVTEMSRKADIASLRQNLVLQENERTDGLVVFTVPPEFQCTEEYLEEDDITLFHLTSDSLDTKITVFSCFEEDFTSEKFDEYFNAYQDDDMSLSSSSDIIINKKSTLNSYRFYYRVVKYKLFSEMLILFGRFGTLYDEKTDKICIFFSVNSDNHYDYIEEFAKGVKFL